MTKVAGIYAITHINSRRAYVGSAVNINRRWYLHRKALDAGVHHSNLLQRAWSKHGRDAFMFVILEETAPIRDVLLRREQLWIDDLQSSKRGRGYNIAAIAGSTLGYKHTSATKLKLAAVQLGRKHSPDHIEANRRAQTGRKRSPETCIRIGAIHKGKKLSADQRAAIAVARKGTKASPETRAKMSASKRGIKRSAECCAKMAIARTGSKLSAETRAKIGATRAAIMTPELRQKYRVATLRFYAQRQISGEPPDANCTNLTAPSAPSGGHPSPSSHHR